MFNHLPPDGKCEWIYIKPFVDQFNQDADTDYRLEECLDVKHRNIKAPEVLLKDSCGRRLLIERKTISWPPERFEILRSEYGFMNRISNALHGELSEGLYALRIEISSLNRAYGKKHRAQWTEIADTIANAVKRRKDRILAGSTIGSRKPVPWACGMATQGDMGISDDAKNGLTTIVYGGWHILEGSFDNIDSIQQRLPEAATEVQSKLTDLMNNAEKKFEVWHSDDDPLRILIIEPYGDIDIVLGNGVFEKMVQTTGQGRSIDQIWLAEEDWISEDDYIVGYKQCLITSELPND